MNAKIKFYLADFDGTTGVSEELINYVQTQLEFSFPHEYVEFVKFSDGWEGEVGENSWLNLFSIEKLIQTNNDYSLLMNDIPDYYLIGKDSADTGFAFHKWKHTFHSFGLMSNFKTDRIEFCGNSFFEFIERLYNR